MRNPFAPPRLDARALAAFGLSLAVHALALGAFALAVRRPAEPAPGAQAPPSHTRVRLWSGSPSASGPLASAAPATAPPRAGPRRKASPLSGHRAVPEPRAAEPSPQAAALPAAPGGDRPPVQSEVAEAEPVGSESQGSSESSGAAEDGAGSEGQGVGEGDGQGLSGSGVGGPGGAGQGEAEGPDLEALHRRLAASAKRCYPPAARRFRLKGEVKLTFCIDASGGLSSVELQGTTGSPLLDRAAQACVVQGALPLKMSGCRPVLVRFAEP
ncbi:MAG: TonB family protein [Myxococcales bacterium]|nr:TonB family protein [Myxococcales bacterium]